MHRKLIFFRQRHENSSPRRAIEFSHYESRHARGLLKCLDLRKRVLADRCVQNQQDRMRRVDINLLDNAHNLLELQHQFGLVLQSPRGIDQQHIAVVGLCGFIRLEGKTCRIRTMRSRDDRRLRAFAPDF